MSCFSKPQKFTLLDLSTIIPEGLPVPELPPLLRHLQKHRQTCSLCTAFSSGKLGAASNCYSYSDEEKRKLEEEMRSKGLL